MHGGEHDAVFHRAIERQAEVVVDALNGAGVVVVVDAHGQRVAGEHHVVQLRHRHADQAGVGFRRRFRVEFLDHAPFGVGGGDHQLHRGRAQVVEAEHFEIQRAVDHQHHGGVAVEGAVAVDVGAGQPVVVAGGAAQAGDAAERRIEGGEHQLFVHREAVQQGEHEGVVGVDPRHGRGAALAQQAVGELLGVGQAEAVEPLDQARTHREETAVEADGDDGAAVVAAAGDLAGGGAAAQGQIAEGFGEGAGQAVEPVVDGAEEQHATEMIVPQLCGQLTGGEALVAGVAERGDHGAGRNRVHRSLACGARR